MFEPRAVRPPVCVGEIAPLFDERWKYRDVRTASDRRHFGQRKLLISEVEFLTLVFSRGEEILRGRRVAVAYAGAAPGTHIPLLVALFPGVDCWVLVDPAKFDRTVARAGVEIVNSYFTDATARELRARFPAGEWCLLLVSDIRTQPTEDEIAANMAMQAGWARAAVVDGGLFKFRLPYSDAYPRMFRYLSGHLYIQAWPRVNSAETRLAFFARAGALLEEEYDCRFYEVVMNIFNNTVRSHHSFHHPLGAAFPYSYDCVRELFVWLCYVELCWGAETPAAKWQRVRGLFAAASVCNGPVHVTAHERRLIRRGK